MEFETYQPATIRPNSVIKPSVFNGRCLIRKYKVTVEEIIEEDSILAERLLDLYKRRNELKITYIDNVSAMYTEAKKLGIELTD